VINKPKQLDVTLDENRHKTLKTYNQSGNIKPSVKFDDLDRFKYMKDKSYGGGGSGVKTSNQTSMGNPLLTNSYMNK